MTRIIAIALVLGVAVGLPASALGQGSGEDTYTQETPPTVGDDGSTDTGTGTDTSGVAGTEGTATGTGTGTGTASGTASGTDPATGAQLPRTGSETGVLAAIGAALLASGLLLRRRTRTG